MTRRAVGAKRSTRVTQPNAHEADRRFRAVVEAFARDRRVSTETGKGFGSGALKVNGKIFAMISSNGSFVVKLPKNRVDELVHAGQGTLFEPRPGRRMKEWLVVTAGPARWIDLATEAHRFVKAASSSAR